MQEEMTTAVIPGSAKDMLRRMLLADRGRLERINTAEQRDRITSQFLAMDMPEGDVHRKVYLEDLVRSQVASLQASSATAGINAMKEWWTNRSVVRFAQVLNADLVVKVSDGVHVPLGHVTTRDWATVCKRRQDRVDASTAELDTMREIKRFLDASMNADETLGDLTEDRIEKAIGILA